MSRVSASGQHLIDKAIARGWKPGRGKIKTFLGIRRRRQKGRK